MSKYRPEELEQATYRQWEAKNHFQPAGQGQPYCILIPPPNITGTLHMGHAFQHTLIDTMIRYRRMKGDRALWQVGTDHAGIATQMVVERQLEDAGSSRQQLGRKGFLKKVWEWRNSSGTDICRQLRRIGSSVDWSRERFTMDADYSQAVVQTFVTLHEEGLIYRGKRLVNWDPVLGTAISDLEVDNREQEGRLYYIRYPLLNNKSDRKQNYLVVATTRPETMLGDVAIAVNPHDERYKSLIGSHAELPLVGRKLPVIADDYVDSAFGTGCLKVTPAHDFNDYEIGKRHSLEQINILTAKAEINDQAPPAYRGLDRFEARKGIVRDLAAAGLLEKEETHRLTVPLGDRSEAVIEPRITDQWFVSMEALAAPALEAVKSGQLKFVPKNYENIYFVWLENIQDWCISRQQWWGHRIPAWYDSDGNIHVGLDEADVRRRHSLERDQPLRQEEDVLETWFSSGIWSFASLGWPQQTALSDYHPTNVLFTGHDIIFFWVARMVMLSLKLQGQLPFREVYVHGLIRDSEGKKMSKSRGNGLDPLDLIDGIDLESLVAKRTTNLMQPQMVKKIEQATRKDFPRGIPAFGTDALRFTFCAMAARGRDIPFDLKRIEGYHHFCNKLWNAAHFVFSHVEKEDFSQLNRQSLEFDLVDNWILACLNRMLAEAEQALSNYRFDLLAQAIYEFLWHEYCDWYLECSKATLLDPNASEIRRRSVRYRLASVLETTLRSLHPVMPFITEALWQQCRKIMGIASSETVMLAAWPAPSDSEQGQALLADMQQLKRVITAVRTLRAELQIPPGKKIHLLLQGGGFDLIKQNALYIHRLAGIESIEWLDDEATLPVASVEVVGRLKVIVPLAGLIEKQDEIARLTKRMKATSADLERFQKQLENQNFLARAPHNVIQAKQQKARMLESTLTKLHSQLKSLKSL